MKTMLLGAAAAVAMLTPGLAMAETSGSLTLTYDNNDIGSSQHQDYSLGGTVVHELSDTMTLQADGRTTLQDWECCNGSYTQSYAAAHLSWDLGAWDVGAFGGMVSYFDDGGVVLGGETRTAFGNFSLDGFVAITDFGDNGYDGSTVRGGGAFFFTPNLALTGGASFTQINSSNDYDILELSIGGAYQFPNNLELFGGYTDSEYEPNIGTDYDGETFRVGLRVNLNGGTLQDNANDGAWTSATAVSDTWSRW